MKLRFSKMHGLGNDFVVIDGIRQTVSLTERQYQQLADRHFGIGCDQILVVEKSPNANADFRYRIFNADGGEVEQCGNGARCFARFVYDNKLSDKREIRVETAKGIIVPRLEEGDEVTVDMGVPRFLPEEIPFIARATATGETLTYDLPVDGQILRISVVSMGNPHAVQIVDNVDHAPVAHHGPLIEAHSAFPERVNAGFMQIIDRQNIRLRVYERGAGETLACGTGACAAVVSGIRLGLLDSTVSVQTRGGKLSVNWTYQKEHAASDQYPAVQMTGPAVTVFSGEIDLDNLVG